MTHAARPNELSSRQATVGQLLKCLPAGLIVDGTPNFFFVRAMACPKVHLCSAMDEPIAQEELDMLTGLYEIADDAGAPRKLAKAVFERFPTPLQQVKLTRSAPDGNLFYYLGGMIDRLHGGAIALPNTEFQLLRHLFECMAACGVRLDNRSQQLVLKQFAETIENKHRDFIEEIAVVLSVPPGIRIDYEVPLLSNDTNVDWQLTAPTGPILLLDVKRRVADLIDNFNQMLQNGGQMDAIQPPEAGLLFKSLEHKFPARAPELFLQGAWIVTGLKHTETALLDAFNALDGKKVHFALVSTNRGRAYVLKREGVSSNVLRAMLGFEESREVIMET